MFPLKRSSVMKCDYCGFVASSAYELLTKHTYYCILRARNVAQRSSRIYKPSVIKRTETQALRSSQLPSARQNNLKNSITKDIRNDSKVNPPKVHYEFRPPVTSSYSPQSIPSSPWGAILNKSEIPVPIFEYGRENKLNNEILDTSEVPVPVPKYIRKNEFLNERNYSSRNNKNFIPSPVTVYRTFPSNSSLERVSSSTQLHQLLEESKRPTTVHSIERRISPVNSNPASSTQLTSSFYDTEPLSIDTVLGSELMSESSSEPIHVMLVSPINKRITIIALDNVMNEIEKRIERLPYEIKLQLENEFLQKVHDAIDKESRREINTV